MFYVLLFYCFIQSDIIDSRVFSFLKYTSYDQYFHSKVRIVSDRSSRRTENKQHLRYQTVKYEHIKYSIKYVTKTILIGSIPQLNMFSFPIGISLF